MIFDQVIQAVVVAAGLLLSAAYYPQLYRIWRARSAEGVSLASYLMFGVGTIVWLAYGFYAQDTIIVLGFLFGAIGSWLVLLSALYFRRKKVKSEPIETE
jgi:MtN3 and saliva related transmembrane protein